MLRPKSWRVGLQQPHQWRNGACSSNGVRILMLLVIIAKEARQCSYCIRQHLKRRATHQQQLNQRKEETSSSSRGLSVLGEAS
ncbi:hypothetical protein FOA52_013103 [Chlamydomonas sp. UWO 241]|nr:hypothetical protein FOA52_013103 [Chlamydomonas sp. UWO 241]